MARPLVQALEGLSFPCDRARVLEFAAENDISPRAMDFLQRLPEQQFASMGELFAVLPSKGSLRNLRPKAVEFQAAPQSDQAPQDAQPTEPAPSAEPFVLIDPWQQIWIKYVESYTRLFMPWLRR